MDVNEIRGVSSSKNILGVVKNIVSGDITFKNIMKDIVLPGVTVFTVDKISYDKYDQSFVETDLITANKFYGIFDKTDNKIIGVINKLSIPSTVDVSIPDIHIPKIDLPRVAA